MDYESRKVKWYWLVLFVGYCGLVAYLLFRGNPYLYSKLDLRSALLDQAKVHLQTIPKKPAEIKPGAVTFRTRYNLQRTGIDPLAITRSKNLLEYQHFPIDSGISDWKVKHVSQDATGFYLTSQDAWVVAVDLTGKVKWKFHFENVPDDRMLAPVLLDESSAYMIQPGGEIVCADKNTGEIRWVRELGAEVVAHPILFDADVLIPVMDPHGVKMLMVRRADGAIEKNAPVLDIQPQFRLSGSADKRFLVATVENKVIAIDTGTWQISWTQTLTDPIHGPAVVINNDIYVATLGAKIAKLGLNRRGHVDWEADLPRPAASPPTYLPISDKLAVMDVNGVLNTLEARSGKTSWHYNIGNRNPLKAVWSARLMGHFIEEFKMDWLHKGWSIWAPCGSARFCIYRADKGQLINRVPLAGGPLNFPLPLGRALYFVVSAKGHYLVSEVLEDTEVKRLLKVQKKTETQNKKPAPSNP